jgi:hypothetical protein
MNDEYITFYNTCLFFGKKKICESKTSEYLKNDICFKFKIDLINKFYD